MASVGAWPGSERAGRAGGLWSDSPQPWQQRFEDRLEHGRGQAPGIGVVARAVIAVGEQKAAVQVSAFQLVERAVREAIGALLEAEGLQDAAMGDGAQGQDRAQPGVSRLVCGTGLLQAWVF